MRRRYIAVRIESKQTFTEKELYDAVWFSMLRLFGEYKVSQAELVLIEYSPEKNQAIFRCSHRTLELAKAALVALTEINNEKTTPRILRISGTLRVLRRKVSNPR